MQCPKCHFENRKEVKCCEDCGARLRLVCPRCGLEIPMGRRYCGECGHLLFDTAWMVEGITPAIVGERKYITVLFSDLSGYTAMTEKLDPEDVKEVMARIFDGITEIAKKYDGFIGRFLGDTAMILFGIPSSHEDDAVRAIRTAREIHRTVEAMSPAYERRIGWPLAMHSGINTGLVVISELDSEKTAGEITGDAVNVSSRLCSLAKAGSILIGPDTYRLAQGYFDFKRCEPVEVKGKSELVQPYEVLSRKEKPKKIHGLYGMQAKLIGRETEMALLAKAVERLQQGERVVISVCGDPGTGKTRIVEEFRATLDRDQFQWLAAYAYGYTQNIPYWPLIDLLNRLWKIEEEDSPDSVRQKIEVGAKGILGWREQVSPIIGSLYSMRYREFENVSPELWKAQLFEGVRSILAAYTRVRPTVICVEDIHWADPPFVDLLRFILSDSTFPALFLCLFRPPFKLFTKKQLSAVGECYQELRLQDLSAAEAQDMMESLLKTRMIPLELKQFIHKKTEGNPFYLEEVINSLIESETLVQDGDFWKLTRALSDSGISPTIQGVITARLDRLNVEWKRILQEASVIGRNFLYVILEHITELKDYLHDCLDGLERLDLIRTKTIQPELEYIFKHALTQEVAYNGLLKRERQVVHERIGQVIEVLFRDRLPEIYETLAFHYKQSNLIYKAVDYLVKSGEKSVKRYAVEESHQYFREAYDLLIQKGSENDGDRELLVDLLIKWAFVYYYSGEFRKLEELVEAHKSEAETLADRAKVGMYYAWLSCALWHREKVREAYDYLGAALKIGEETGNQQLVGYACAWLTWTCMELGRLDEAIASAERAQSLCQSAEMDHYIYFNSLAGLAWARFHRGQKQKAFEDGKTLVDFGQRQSNVRSMVMGYCFMGYSHMIGGNIAAATSFFEEAVSSSVDPWYSQFPSLALCYARIAHGEYHGLQETLERIISFSEERGAEYVGSPGKMLLGAVLAAQGELSRGMKLVEGCARTWREGGSRLRYMLAMLIMGRIYARIAQGEGQRSFSTIFRNLWFVIRKGLFADRKAVQYLSKAIELADEMGAKDTLGRACLTLGILHQAKGRDEQARECLCRAAGVFEECGADEYLQKAKEALKDLA